MLTTHATMRCQDGLSALRLDLRTKGLIDFSFGQVID